MNCARVLGLGPAFRRAALQPRAVLRNQVALRNVVQRRGVMTQIMKPEQVTDILNAQRVVRPNSPHMTIYQPQLTWVLSIFNRGTGVALSVLLYGFSVAYVAAPLAGIPFTGADVVNFVAGMPDAVKVAGKLVLAAPFSLHAWNGLRHLSWDMGKLLTVKGCYSSGYLVLGATAVTTIGLLFV
ncbi:SDHC, cytochrome b subunit of succinate dehydrogenase [Schizopora paradoxa]|uniref:SDHC, cytochrome b subunit of succinate dehydrogenase n=1 Tax=Schizopora paradoxa TaxID=27342 RepID=A0A0H2SKN6_9AGAM|nr:SDHC, cytochrome b subunit of succinate dehydrogenase [Schizopora paradoxa]